MRNLAYIVLITLFSCSSGHEETVHGEIKQHDWDERDTSPYGDHKLIWNFESDFEKEEKEKLKDWIYTVVDATTETIGHYPFDMHFYFERSDYNDQAVSFGHTIRGEKQSVKFYVDPTFSREEFLSDWVAPHEISHLSQPFVGKQNKWFSEGYATYMSRQIMIKMGYYTEEGFDSLYQKKIGETKVSYNSSTMTHIQVSDSLLGAYNYGFMYWGSASFFYTIDKQLRKKHKMRFRDVVKEYQSCCRLTDKSLLTIISSYDSISNDSLFSSLMKKYRNKPAYEVMKNY